MAAQTPAPVGKVTVRPGTATVTVTITGNNPTAWTSQSGAATHTMPLAISADTDFWLVRGTYTVTTTLSGVTIDVSTVQIESGTGATVDPKADTLTELAGLLSAGSGAIVTDRAQYHGSASVASGDLVTWDPTRINPHGRALLDFTDPQAPIATVAGRYFVSVWAQDAGGNAGKFWRLDLELDGNGDDLTLETSGALDMIASQNPTLTVAGEWYIPLGGSVFCEVDHDAGGSIGNYRLYVALVAEG